jgi:ABC-type transport system involved in multi-copper enzyme maturation permease subunit
MTDVLASFRGEWLKLCKRPATWVLGLVLVALLLVVTYGFVVLAVVVLGGSPSRPGAQAALLTLKPTLYPAHFLGTALGAFSGIGYGNAIAVIVGVLAYGSEYGWGTLKTVFTQRPGRLATMAGKLLAVALILAVYAAAFLAAGAAASAVLGGVYGALTPWPGILDVAKAFLAAWLLMGLWTAFGVALAVLLRQAALAIGLGIVYAIAVEGIVINTLSLVSSLQNVQRAFPGANATALVGSFGRARAAPALVEPTQAVLVVAAYLVLFLVVSAVSLRRSDVA